jgi:hypothetical protein
MMVLDWAGRYLRLQRELLEARRSPRTSLGHVRRLEEELSVIHRDAFAHEESDELCDDTMPVVYPTDGRPSESIY